MQFSEHDDALEQSPRVERAPVPVGNRSGPVGHYHMIMELGVAGFESQWVNAVATTPSTTSWTTPFLPSASGRPGARRR